MRERKIVFFQPLQYLSASLVTAVYFGCFHCWPAAVSVATLHYPVNCLYCRENTPSCDCKLCCVDFSAIADAFSQHQHPPPPASADVVPPHLVLTEPLLLMLGHLAPADTAPTTAAPHC